MADAAVLVEQPPRRRCLSPLYTLAVIVEAIAAVYKQIVIQVVRIKQGVVDAHVRRYTDRRQWCRGNLHRFAVVDTVQAARKATATLQVTPAGTQAWKNER